MKIDKSSIDTIEKSLFEIAENFIKKRAFKINNHIFSFTDLEIYYWHKNHPDDYARGVNHIKESGHLEAHRYGLDISLDNLINKSFGGLLISGLYNDETNIYYHKSQILRTIINATQIGNNEISIIINHNKRQDTFRTVRSKLGKADNENKLAFYNKKYRIIVRDKEIFRQLKNKELIIKNSDIKTLKEKKSLLGYKIS